ncbi:MAG: hypothetical protein KBD78_06310 [Oligoflexales bacterium]|nr:hypothetical protein [Oligoflexales bacterium]
MNQLEAKSRLVNELRNIIAPGYSGTQSELCELLKDKGLQANQSSISRALSKLGVVKFQLDGVSRYELKNDLSSVLSSKGSLAKFVLSISSNEANIVVSTTPGSAMFVAAFIDQNCKGDILGAVAGDDTILIAPRSCKMIKKHLAAISTIILN